MLWLALGLSLAASGGFGILICVYLLAPPRDVDDEWRRDLRRIT